MRLKNNSTVSKVDEFFVLIEEILND